MTPHQFWMVAFATFIVASITVAIVLSYVATAPDHRRRVGADLGRLPRHRVEAAMTLGPLGYGRYNDEPEQVGCPRAKSDMTPCVARDGHLAVSDPTPGSIGLRGDRPIPASHGVCVGCGKNAADLLTELVKEVTKP